MHKIDTANGIRMRRQLPHDARGANVPKVDGFVVRAGDEHVAGRRKGDGVDVVVVAEEGERMWVASSS